MVLAGIIVDEVYSVNVVPEEDIEQMGENTSYDTSGFIKGIIKVKKGEDKEEGLVIWLDMEKVLGDLIYKHQE